MASQGEGAEKGLLLLGIGLIYLTRNSVRM